ncbi:MAG TPA: SDR family NAD(P)-dependent oxidoreductase, partial [Chloroflexota bacterium]|nr:SDR family NAD(P)-dependent oxidoreductase [Chloroflexota bacterium]
MSEGRFSGKNVFITGGGSGFGRASARRFAQEGAATIFLVDRIKERLDSAVPEIQALGAEAVPVQVDLASTEDCDRAVQTALEHAGRLDVLISNAGAWTSEPFLEMKDASWQRVVAVNLTASFVLGQRVARSMATTGGGVILYTASISATGAGRGMVHYCATKAGIVTLVKVMAVELAEYGIRVNSVSPGPADTQQSVDVAGAAAMEQFRKSFPVVPMNRLARAEDIAATFAFLASDDAAYITGQNIIVDGGLT